ncbi:sensor histidine kinase [Hymenobacter arizonensis]|uniref:histidine kinase n=1 Tax=Hymenobacter arizonensis TaxID=1227077 RepID=A0A1I6BRD3_HYMAR|nr:PAS domain-containing protein [Hymenobacter arizonensis]SFQ83496.1 Signal transduction histidine kinase [Hymenobacter arizonensis]
MTPRVESQPPGLPASFLPALLQLLPNGVMYYLPAYDAAGTVVDFRIAYLNPSAQRMLGLPAEPTATYLQLWPGTAASGAFAFHRDAFNSSQPARLDEFYQADGHDLCIRAHACRLEGGLLVSFTDAADQPRTAVEEALRQRQAFHDIFEQTPALIALLRQPGHRFEYANAAYQALFPGRQLVGLDLAAAVPELYAQGYVQVMDQVYRTGETFVGEELPFVLPGAAGEAPRTRYFNFTYQAYRESGAIAGVSIFAFDATEQALARQERETHRQQLHDLFEKAPVAIAIFRGPRYVIELANPAVCAIWGRTPAQALHTPLFELLPEAAGQGFEALLDGVMATGVPYLAHELPSVIDRHGRRDTVYWNFLYEPLPDASGAITGVTVVATEVTEQVRARQQVETLNRDLATANTHLHSRNTELGHSNHELTRTNVNLDTFIYTASHDLRAPITNLEGLLHALCEELPAAVQQADGVPPLLDRMQLSVDRFKLTIAQLTDLTKLQRADQQPAETVDLATLVADIRLDLEQQLTDARLTVDVAGCPNISFAPKNLRSIVYNLLSNALKYRSPDRPPQVRLRCRSAADGTVVLDVRDNGLGLTVAQQSQLFGLFRRLHDHVEGSGIGLFMVKRIVENAGGAIAVQSAPGVGTTFTITLPAPVPAAAEVLPAL